VDINLDYIADFYTTSDMIIESVGLIVEDYESGEYDMFDWQFNNNPWELVGADEAYEGEYASRSSDINDNQTSTMFIDYSVASGGEFSFWYKVSSEENYDFLRFYINDNEVATWAGEVDWTQASFDLEAGDYTFKWEYDKDGSVSDGDDCAWVDFVVFPASPADILVASFEAEPLHSCLGDVVSFTDQSFSLNSMIVSWNWNFGDPASGSDNFSVDQNPNHIFSQPGTYTITLTIADADLNEATITKIEYITVHNCTGVSESKASLNIYPNPSNGEFFLDIQGLDAADLKIYDALGTLVYEESNLFNDNSMKRIDLSNAAEGVYLLIIENDQQKMIERIIVK
jgi:PKD repeat protein